jgi:Protein of unknown function (DUF1552)
VKGQRISRRLLLRGIGGTVVGLPLLEAMLDGPTARRAHAAELPRRYVVVFGGFSLGASSSVGSSAAASEPIDFVPRTAGRGYDLPAALAPLGVSGVAGDVSVVSGLKVPWAKENGGVVPAGGRPDTFHALTASGLLSGVRSDPGEGENSHARCSGPTSDQIVAPILAGATAFPSLQYRAEAIFYSGNGPDNARDIMSWKAGAAGGKPVAVPPDPSPAAAFRNIFGSIGAPASAQDAAKRDFLLRSRRSILDLVHGDTDRLLPRLGAFDRARIGNHLDQIRDLEKRLADQAAAAGATMPAGVCAAPQAPGADPAVNDGLNYSGEEQRAARFCDLIALALACDRTRVATLMLSTFQSALNMDQLIGVKDGLHNIGHKGSKDAANKAAAWHVRHFAELVAKLKTMPEGAGTVLDNTALVFVCEGGIGMDPSTGQSASVHSSENMACMLAGRVGGLKPGAHIPSPGQHPAKVLISAMKAVGGPQALGEVSGIIPGLFS